MAVDPLNNFKFVEYPTLQADVNRRFESVPEEVADAYIHPSSFHNWCRRREVYRLLQQQVLKRLVPRSTGHSAETKAVFEIGHALHDRWRNVVLSDQLLGVWKCMECGHVHGRYYATGTGIARFERCLIRVPEKCENTRCEAVRHHKMYPTFGYIEPRLHDHKTTIGGSSDGLIFLHNKWRVLELKSKRSDLWAQLTAPEPSHVLQMSLYGWLLNETKMLPEPITSGAIVYIQKDTGKLKTYICNLANAAVEWAKKEAVAIQEIVHYYFSRISTLDELTRLAYDTDFNTKVPRVCDRPSCRTAQQCHSRAVCFGLT